MLNETLKRWLKSLLFSLVFAILYFGYLYIRRGAFSLSLINKTLAALAIFLAGFTLLISPLKEKIPSLLNFMTIRRHLGLLAFAAALAHLLISVFFIPQRFNLAWYQQEWLGVTFGVIAIVIWVYLTILSRNAEIIRLGAETWKKHQSLGARIAFWLVFFHLILLKYTDWLTYFSGQTKASAFLKNPTLPPESFFVFVLMITIIIYRLIFDMQRKKNSHLKPPDQQTS